MKKKFKFFKSQKNYQEKPDVKYITWEEVEGDDYDMYHYSIDGYTLCWDCIKWGYTKYGKYTLVRSKDNWEGSNYVYIDLDDVELSWNELTQGLMNTPTVLRPNYMYTSYSHKKTINNLYKGNRYRIVYYFEETITDKEIFVEICNTLNKAIKEYFNIKDSKEEKVDNHNRVLTQPMHGTSKNALNVRCSAIHKICKSANGLYITNGKGNIPLSTSLNFNNNNNLIDSINETSGKSIEIKELFNKEEKVILRNTKYKDYINGNINKYIIYTDNWQSLGDSAKRVDVIDIKPTQFWDKNTQSTTPCITHNGQGRRKKLSTISKKLKVINPNITRDEMLYNIVYWMYNYTDGNDVDPIKWNDMLDIVNRGMASNPKTYMSFRLKLLTDAFKNGNKKCNPDKILKNPYTTSKRRYECREKKLEKYYKLENKSIQDMIIEMNISRATAFRIKKEANDTRSHIDPSVIFDYFDQGFDVKEVMSKTGLGKSRVYKLRKQWQNKQDIDAVTIPTHEEPKEALQEPFKVVVNNSSTSSDKASQNASNNDFTWGKTENNLSDADMELIMLARGEKERISKIING